MKPTYDSIAADWIFSICSQGQCFSIDGERRTYVVGERLEGFEVLGRHGE